MLEVSYRTRKPLGDEHCPLRLSTRLAAPHVNLGETVELQADVVNLSGQEQPWATVVLGLPGGLEPCVEQLEGLRRAGVIDEYQICGREVLCAWHALAAQRKLSLRLNLVAAAAGRFIGPASRAYLGSRSNQQQWADPLEVEIGRVAEWSEE